MKTIPDQGEMTDDNEEILNVDECDECDYPGEQCDPHLFAIGGEPGTGKSHVLIEVIRQAGLRKSAILVACPTGLLAAQYGNTFGEMIDAKTIHSAFQYPVNEDESPTINWDLVKYQLIVIDEVSQVSAPVMRHVLNTIHSLPTELTFVICGDKYQIPPIGSNRCVNNIYNMSDIKGFTHFTFTEHFRVADVKLRAFLAVARYSQPTARQLSYFLQSQLFSEGIDMEEKVKNVIKTHPDTTFLAVTNAAVDNINEIVTETLFAEERPLLQDVTLGSLEKLCGTVVEIYKGQRVVITQNVSSTQKIVNGKCGVVHSRSGKTMIIKTNDAEYLPVFPLVNNSGDSYYPLRVAYAKTIYRARI